MNMENKKVVARIAYSSPKGLAGESYEYFNRYVELEGKSLDDARKMLVRDDVLDKGLLGCYSWSELRPQFRKLIEERLGIDEWHFDSLTWHIEPSIDLVVTGTLDDGQLLSMSK